MVKIPGLDDLKKMGADLIDSAKSVNLGETVDKLKAKVEAMGGKKETPIAGDNAAQMMLASIAASLAELMAAHALQASAIKKIQDQLTALNKIIEADLKAPPSTTPTPPRAGAGDKQEDTKQ